MLKTLFRSNPHGWVIVGVSFATLSLVFSARSSLGLMMPTWEQEFGWTRSFVSGGGAAMLVVMAAIAPIAGNLLDRIGPRLLYGAGLTLVGVAIIATGAMGEKWHFIAWFSAVGGIGFGIVGVPLVATTVALYFESNRGLATSIATAGVGAGQLMVLPVLAAFITALGWRPSFFGYGALLLVFAAATLIMVRGGVPDQRRGGGLTRTIGLGEKIRLITSNRTYWLLAFGYVICGFTTTGVVKVHLLPYAAACGYPPLASTTAYGVLAAFNIVGMLLAGYLADRMSRPLLLGGIYILRALTFILLMYIARDLSLLFIFAVAFGMLDFATIPVIASLVASHIGLRVMGLTMGILAAGHALGGAAGAFLGGWLFDLFNRYDWVWVASFALALVAGALTLCVRRHPPEGSAAAAA
ncbi:MAG: MFS transporter [Alphaproteobacteria bacterium]